MWRVGVMVVAAVLGLFACSDEPNRRLALLDEADLDGEWRKVPSDDVLQPICGVNVPSRQGESSSRGITLLSEPDNAALVTHELVEYRSRDDADAAMAVFDSASTCSEFTRPDGESEATVEVEKATVPGHDEVLAVRLLVTWADGSGQGYVATAQQQGDSISYLTLDAPQGGIPSADAVADLLELVQADS